MRSLIRRGGTTTWFNWMLIDMGSRKRFLCIAMICMMLFSTTVVHAATISTFSSGNSEVTVELRDQGIWGDDLTAGIKLPAGETVNSAGLILGTDYAEQASVDVLDASVMDHIWNPAYNTGLTQYSANGDFTIDEDYIKMTSLGYNADFEGTDNTRGWTTGPDQGFMTNWGHGIETDIPAISAGCAVGDWCWGTDFDGADYTMFVPDSSRFEYTLTSESFYVTPGKSDLLFNSFHSLFFRSSGSSSSYYYDDCAYVAVMNSTNNQDWNTASYVPFDVSGSTGISPSNGMYVVGTAVNQVPSNQCDYLGSNGPQSGDYVLAGNGSTNANSANGGWSNLKASLGAHAGRYVKLLFVMEANQRNGALPAEMMNAGWYVDGVRVGDPLPAQGHVTMSSFAPQASAQPDFPDGYGLLQLDLEKPASAAFGVDILDAGSGNVVIDRHGNSLTNLQGSLIELWDINADTYPLIDLKFSFGSGPSRIATPILHGLSLGTRIGTTFNNTGSIDIMGGMIGDGKWTSSMTEESGVMISSSINDASFGSGIRRNVLSMPIVAIKPVISDACGGPNEITIMSLNSDQLPVSAVNGVWSDLSTPTFGFAMMSNYTTSNLCDVYSIHADLRFAHHSEGISLDVGADGDIDWAMNDPAFGHFGRQDMFRTGVIEGVNMGDGEKQLSLDISLNGEGAPFLLPKGSTVSYADVSFDQNSIGSFDVSIVSGNQEVNLGEMESSTEYSPAPFTALTSIQDDLQSLLDNPLVPTAVIDSYGNEWYLFRFKVDATQSSTATSGDSVNFRNLNIVYEWSRAFSGDNFARELNQGVALASTGGVTGDVIVPMQIVGGSGGAMKLHSLSVSTTSGYSSTLDIQGLEGMYPNGEIIEMISIHDVASATGQSLAGASLLFETSNGNLELQWSAANDTFWEQSDPGDYVNFMAAQSLSIDDTSGKELRWRFRVNPEWDDTASVRVYASTISDTGVNGLPSGALVEPASGNAVENDVSITDFHLLNQGGVEQNDLSNAFSSNAFTLDFTVRYEDLEVAPNPNNYHMLLQKRNQDNLSEEWLFVDTIPGTIDGNYSWSPSLPVYEAGTEHYRLLIENYTDGDTNCPPVGAIVPDSDCAIRFSISLDPFSPHLVNISVAVTGQEWREITDDTWIPSKSVQRFRVYAQDLPLAPESLTLNYWVEASHDANNDREAQLDEYQQQSMPRIDAANTSAYEVQINDYANFGIDPPQLVSLFVSGTDVGGNSIDGGSDGLAHDLVTYIGMGSRAPQAEQLRIMDSNGIELNSLNKDIYAGNVYHLLIDANDPNGWLDIDYFTIQLNPFICSPTSPGYDSQGTMEIYYSPVNDTAWETNGNTWVEIIDDYDNTGLKPTMLRRDGGVLISSFEQDFTLDIPVRFDWAIPESLVATPTPVQTPAVKIMDLDPNRDTPPSMQASNSQPWVYSSGLYLDTTTLSVEDTSGFTSTGVGSQNGGFVNRGDILHLTGRYVFSDSFLDLSMVTPEIPMTLELTSTPIYPNGEVDKPGSGYIPAAVTTSTYLIENGTFDLLIAAPIQTNEFTYTMTLINLPTGANDETPTPSKSFVVKVDGDAPEAVFGSWELSNSQSGLSIDGDLSSAVMNCVDVELYIDEYQGLDTDSVELNWMFFEPVEVGGFEYNWSEYVNTYTEDWEVDGLNQSLDLDDNANTGRIRATFNCLNIWPDGDIPSDMEDVLVKFWVTGHDTAGNAIGGGGQFGGSVDGDNGVYGLKYEAAEFTLSRVSLSTSSPEAKSELDLLIDMTNDGTMEGTLVIELVTYINGKADSPVEYRCPQAVAPGGEYLWRLSMPQFPEPATNVRYVIYVPGEESPVHETDPFNVGAESTKESEGAMLWLAVAAIVCLLVVAVVIVFIVVSRETEGDEDEYIDDEDFLPPGEAVEPIRSRGPPATRAEERRGPPGSRRGPPQAAAPVRSQMDIAKEKFPFWDEATIQGYFDQGWNIDQLEEWLASQ